MFDNGVCTFVALCSDSYHICFCVGYWANLLELSLRQVQKKI